ncbi:MAG: 2-oxoglutarate dehydrogenase E1 component, partial [Bacteroidales bacterium]|nr:2-oxoglutarate dehydrogenase E1 component [Bacteroidales bacterium]
MDKHEYLNQADSSAIEELYKNYLLDPQSVDISWRRFFEGFEFARGTQSILPAGFTDVDTEFRVLNLIDWYRKRGHLFTKTNPVRERRKYFPTLDIENYGLSEADLNVEFQAGKQIGIGPATLREIIHHLQETYCQSIGAEFMYIRKAVILEWLQKRMESTQNRVEFSRDEKIKIFKHINSAVAFEKFIHKKFVGQKRFSLEGIEALIPALDQVIEKGSQLGIREFTIGMAHRGRLNVLANIMQKPFVDIFREFKGTDYAEGVVLGDVKYHLGYDREVTMEDDQT